jgi:hypothetical protein
MKAIEYANTLRIQVYVTLEGRSRGDRRLPPLQRLG